MILHYCKDLISHFFLRGFFKNDLFDYGFLGDLHIKVYFNLLFNFFFIGRTDAAFGQAQRAKALAVGRLLTPSPNAQAAPISEAELVATKLMSTAAGGENQISRQELFIEYFVGPTRAWAFYVFAPGDPYEPMKVVELQRQALITDCSDVVRAIQTGGQPTDPAQWLLAGKPNVTIASLWALLGEFKKPDRELRRVVIAPDGPLCYAPLHIIGVDVFSSVTYLPTAAVLKSSEYISSRDLKLMWDGQRSYSDGVVDEPRGAGRLDGRHLLTLWSGVTLPILLQDAAR